MHPYSYKFFFDDGYGKDFNILNLAEEHEEETRPLYLTACLVSFYQQCRRFADGGSQLVPYLLEAPLMVFVGGSVTDQRQAQDAASTSACSGRTSRCTCSRVTSTAAINSTSATSRHRISNTRYCGQPTSWS